MDRTDPFVSVVTPVYNGEKFLRHCIESVLAQTYPHWDYTIVNNCSTDATGKIAREYAAQDPRIRVHDNEQFIRVIENYNMAVEQTSAHSKYCKVVAADDRLFPECLEKMVDLAERHPNVGIVGAYGLAGYERPKVTWQGVPFPDEVVPGHEACRSMLLGGPFVFGAPTAVLYRADLLRSRPKLYNEANFQADVEACLELLEHSDFGFVHQVLTFQGVRDDSLSSFSAKFGTDLPWILTSLLRYGPTYLGEAEMQERIRRHMNGYYWYLGRQVFLRRGPEFWKFHRDKLAEAGRPLDRVLVARRAFGCALDVLLNPKRTGGIVRRWLQGRMSRGGASD
jgi:glycosyltransferase involved in cell wall biosynthesis